MTTPGEKILVPTEVDSGAFPGEKLVTVSTNEGPISGFANANLIVQDQGGQYLPAEVKDVSEDGLTVVLSGSFFTTTGLAILPTNTKFRKATG